MRKFFAPHSQAARILRDRVKWRIRTLVGSLRQRMAPRGSATTPNPAEAIELRADLLRLRPDPYTILRSDDDVPMLVFEVRDMSDFDWMERVIVDNGYYETAHVWQLRVDRDKRVMAEIVASLSQGGRVLELGCASGAVLEGLALRGLDFSGVDISHMARRMASDAVRDHIYLGDILLMSSEPQYDTIFGLDIFEHLNPNRLDKYLSRLRALLVDGGLLFANIPGFGEDEVFGEIFPRYLREWDVDAATGRPFRYLHVDQEGYPIHGHLIWAESTWWVEQFAKVDLVRRPVIELALHRKYDGHLSVHSPARRCFYVFSAGDCPNESKIATRIAQSPSLELMTLRRFSTLAMLW